MWKLSVLFLTLLLVVTCLKFKFANLASILPNQLVQKSGTNTIGRNNGSQVIVTLTTSSSNNLQSATLTTPSSVINTNQSPTPTPASSATTATAPSTTRRNLNQNLAQDDQGPGQGPPPSVNSVPNNDDGTTPQSPNGGDSGGGGSGTDDPNQQPDDNSNNNGNKKQTQQPTTTSTGNDTSLLPQSPLPPFHSNDKSSSFEQTNSSYDLGILFYSVFIVYVSFVKLLYHNVHFIKHNLTEQGILMVFGIIWQLITRQLSSDYESFPRFNSRIFFYLFLPSTVLESASLLSNKWLFFNLLQILTHSIIGTVLYASAMGFTIYSLGRSNIFTLDWIDGSMGAGGGAGLQSTILTGSSMAEQSIRGPSSAISDYQWQAAANDNNSLASVDFYGLQQQQQQSRQQLENSQAIGPDVYEFSNLTLADCLIFGTILSSIDSAPMLNVFKQYQVNEKLYYLVLGENLMNNAVVIMIFSLLIDFFGTTRLTVVKIYIAMLQFFANLIGAILIGFALALFALISVRLTKRFQLANHLMSSYQNQCQAMIETLLILKLAYLTYTLANLAGTSSIVSLATFGILNDQYIKHNLNLRSQLAFRQVILAMKTMGFSLVYPLLGMLLVDTALNSSSSNYPQQHHHHQQQHHHDHHQHQQQHQLGSKIKLESTNLIMDGRQQPDGDAAAAWQYHLINDTLNDDSNHHIDHSHQHHQPVHLRTSASVASKRLATLAGMNWNFKFLSIVVILTILYRFLIVIALGLLGNVLTCGQIKIKFKEQMLMAYGGFKGPLSIALVHSLIEHNDHKDRMASSRHLFKYTILFNIFISAVLAGTFLRPLVARIQSTLIGHLSTNLDEATNRTIVFEQINYKLTEYVSHGLNSVLGHTRSPYEKFIEFNETHIKRWLVRDGTSNTHWLSIFYDNLILDETLNANCFYIATEDPTTMRTFRNQEKQRQAAARLADRAAAVSSSSTHSSKYLWHRSGRQRSSVGFMDTISENRVAPHVVAGSYDRSNLSSIDLISLAGTAGGRHQQQHQQQLKAPTTNLGANSSRYRARKSRQVVHQSGVGGSTRATRGATSRVAHNSKQMEHIEVARRAAAAHEATTAAAAASGGDKEEVLKEFVMLNLKLEEAKKRRQAAQGKPLRGGARGTHLAPVSTTSESEAPSYDGFGKYKVGGAGGATVGMIDSSAATSGPEQDDAHDTLTRLDSSTERRSKQRFLSELELRLADGGGTDLKSRASGQTFRLGPAARSRPSRKPQVGRITHHLTSTDKATPTPTPTSAAAAVADKGTRARGRGAAAAFSPATGPSTSAITHHVDGGGLASTSRAGGEQLLLPEQESSPPSPSQHNQALAMKVANKRGRPVPPQ